APMAETLNATLEWDGPGEETAPQTSATSMALLLFLAVLLALGGLFIPGQVTLSRIGTGVSWMHFGQQILRQTLLTAAGAVLALAASSRFPQAGLIVERVVIHPPRR